LLWHKKRLSGFGEPLAIIPAKVGLVWRARATARPLCCDLGLGSQPVIKIASVRPALLFPDFVSPLPNSLLVFG
jgi:hypothetical protein